MSVDRALEIHVVRFGREVEAESTTGREKFLGSPAQRRPASSAVDRFQVSPGLPRKVSRRRRVISPNASPLYKIS